MKMHYYTKWLGLFTVTTEVPILVFCVFLHIIQALHK